MSKAHRIWSGDWRRRIMDRLRLLGFSGMTEFLKRVPAVPYVDLATDEHLGPDVAAFQIMWLHFGEANTPEKLRDAAIDSFTRDVNYNLPNGWGQGKNLDFNTAGVFANWASRFGDHHPYVIAEPQQSVRAKVEAVWAAIKNINPPCGWLPRGPGDPIIVEAFAKGWPSRRGKEVQNDLCDGDSGG